MPSIQSQPPVIGFAAYSGTGKTTLLEKLVPLLVQRGLRVGLVKASHHDVDPDTPGKDSYRLRQAGASQLVLSTPKRSICYTEYRDEAEPQLKNQLELLDRNSLDLVIVEGFRDAAIPKIELRRRCVERPCLYDNDRNIIAIAWDYSPGEMHAPVPQLDINNPDQIAAFILDFLERH